MTLRIDYESDAFPGSYGLHSGTLETSWSELLWAAITIGRPSAYHLFKYGPSSFHEAIFRISLIRMAVEQDMYGALRRTDAYKALDPTEKGMVSYFLGMVICKLFASRLLQTPWLLHLDVFRSQIDPVTLGRSRPDLVGEDITGSWHAFESKGRASSPSADDRTKAKSQAKRLVSVGGTPCSLHIGSFAYFNKDNLEFYWRDPEPDSEDAIKLPEPDREWRFYFEPALRLADERDSTPLAVERQIADVKVEVHPVIHDLLRREEWGHARRRGQEERGIIVSEGFQPDGLKVTAGDSWAKSFRFRERG